MMFWPENILLIIPTENLSADFLIRVWKLKTTEAGVVELFSYVQFINYSICLQVSRPDEIWLADKLIIQTEHNAEIYLSPHDIKLLKDFALTELL